MNKVIAIAMLTFLTCLPMLIAISESVQAQTNQDRKVEVEELTRKSLHHLLQGEIKEALVIQEKILLLQRMSGDLAGEFIALINIGLTYKNRGQYSKALNYYHQALGVEKQTGSKGTGTLSMIGSFYSEIGQYSKALEFNQQVLEGTRKAGDRAGEIATLVSIGNNYLKLENYSIALKSYQQGLSIHRRVEKEGGDGYEPNQGYWGSRDSRTFEGAIIEDIGIAYFKLGEDRKAQDSFRQVLAINEQEHSEMLNSGVYGYIGLTYENLRQSAEAFEYYKKSLGIQIETLKIQQRQVAIAPQGVTFSRIGFLLDKLQNPILAILYLKQSINIRETIRKDIRKLNKDEQRSYLETVSSSYKRLATLLLNQGWIMEALQVLDLLKVQELEDYFKNIKGSDRSAQGVRILEPEKAISSQLATISTEKAPELNRQLASQIQQLPKSEINKVPDYLQQIPKGTVLLYPLILGDQLEIIFFSPNTLPISRTVKISKAKLESLITEYRAGLLDAGSEDVKDASKALYDVLIKPIESELIAAKAETILYAPDAILRYVPLAALYDGKQWLVEKYRISNLIAYTLTDFTAQPKTQPNILAGAFGGKAGEKKFGQNALPATLKEVQAIANSFQNSVTLIEDNFSRQAIESQFKNHNILHLATHASFNTGTPDNSFIIFGNGDKIKLNEISEWQIPNIDLIVLSACQTGVGKLGDGVEILGFGYQVQKAGAKNAIASLWKVNDAGTQALMEAFYGELKKGDVTIAEALRRAQVALIKSPNYNHPNYWSAFFAIGNGL